jgi:crescentin
MKLISKADGQGREAASKNPGPKGLARLWTGAARKAPLAETTAEDIGARYELVTEKLDGAQHLLEHLSSLTDLVKTLRGPVADEYAERCAEHAELQTVRHTLKQTEARLAEAQTEGRQLTQRLAAADAALAEAALRRETQDMALAAKDAELEQVKLDRADSRARAQELGDGLKQALGQVAEFEENAAALRGQADGADRARREATADAARLQQEVSLVQEEMAVLKKHLEQSHAEAARLARVGAELDDRLKSELTRVQDLDAAVRAAEAQSNETSRTSESLAEAARTELGKLAAKAETAQARATRLEDMNADLARAAAEADAAHRAADLEIGDLNLAARRMEERVRSAEAELSDLRRDFASIDTARSAAVERADDLAKTVKKRETALKRTEEKVGELRSRLEAMDAEHGQKRAALEERLAAMESEAERDRAEREITEGALDSARKDRTRLQGALIAVGKRPDVEKKARAVGE